MHQATVVKDKNAPSGLSLSRCGELLHHAIDRLSIEGASSLSPHDRARLASAAAILKQIHDALEEHASR
ncbi:hypothetical protein ASD99_23810 [Mesorhizobium sp. Root695]|jgi:hypothetical protein|uniref:hypothetical protein n=1 Tax=unclassified Mesorhizobium TaxID=325217 RepID=UPI0006F5C2D6|nr:MULTISPECIES: hypothetical protein [unclassified Mesorhizobium]KQU99782.1 hypothetical protein ASD12_18620 [Mesorhizobium sp. Root102]KRB29701.1 hypothetical protein ASD99_23810 [Mesorhizobium sp. Root695]